MPARAAFQKRRLQVGSATGFMMVAGSMLAIPHKTGVMARRSEASREDSDGNLLILMGRLGGNHWEYYGNAIAI